MTFSVSQYNLFAIDLHELFLEAGCEIVIEPHVDYNLPGFEATYLKKQLLHKPTRYDDGIQKSFIHVTGLPVGYSGQKMLIMARVQIYPDNLNDAREVMKLKINFNEFGQPSLSCSPGQPNHSSFTNEKNILCNLRRFVLHIMESILPGLIQLPSELKLEILKKLRVESIVEMSRVNNEFRRLIFYEGETLWKHLCRRDFNLTVINRNVHTTWMELYKDYYIRQLAQSLRNDRALPPTPIFPALPPVPGLLPIAWVPEELEPVFQLDGVDRPLMINNVFQRRGSVESLDNIMI